MDQDLMDDMRRKSNWAKQQLKVLNRALCAHPYDPDRDSSFDDLSNAEIEEYERWLRTLV